MSLAMLERLLAERQRLRSAHRRLQDHATDRDFADQVEALGTQLDRIDHQLPEVIETLTAEGTHIPGELLYDIAESALERQTRRNEALGRRLHDALETARRMI